MTAQGMLMIYLFKGFLYLLAGIGVLVVIVPLVADLGWRINLFPRRQR